MSQKPAKNKGKGSFSFDMGHLNQLLNSGLLWHNFIIYFRLWASAVLNLWLGIYILLGFQYGEYRAAVYSIRPTLMVADIIMGVCCIAIAVFSVFVRFWMAGFKKYAPDYMLALNGLNGGVGIFYSVTVAMLRGILSHEVAGGQVVIVILLAAVSIIIDHFYYNERRMELFVN